MIRSPSELFETIHCSFLFDNLLLAFLFANCDVKVVGSIGTLYHKKRGQNRFAGTLQRIRRCVQADGRFTLIESRTVNTLDGYQMLLHERFVLRRLAAATLTNAQLVQICTDLRFPENSPYLAGSNFSAPLNATRLCLYIQLVSEALVRFMLAFAMLAK